MSTSRRKFLKSGTMVALAAGIPGTVNAAVKVMAAPVSEGSNSALTKAAFEANLNGVFRIRAGGSHVATLTLTKVGELNRYKKGKAAAKNGEGFFLMFDGPRGIAQERYRFEHDRMGKFDLLMVPVESRKRRGHAYEVIINRLFV